MAAASSLSVLRASGAPPSSDVNLPSTSVFECVVSCSGLVARLVVTSAAFAFVAREVVTSAVFAFVAREVVTSAEFDVSLCSLGVWSRWQPDSSRNLDHCPQQHPTTAACSKFKELGPPSSSGG